MPKVLVTGGAGFIGSWVVEELLEQGAEVWVLDDFSNGSEANLAACRQRPGLRDVIRGDVKDAALVDALFATVRFDVGFHLAARINVHDSINRPLTVFEDDVLGTLTVLEAARRSSTKFVFVSTCMVYDSAMNGGIREDSSVLPRSPYAASKLAAENLVTAYHHTYGLPVVILRPFNTYGPRQRSSAEGGVIAIFINRATGREPLRIYGDGTQTRDFLYVADCARFIVRAGLSAGAVGRVINAGSGRDISINALARLIAGPETAVAHVPHIHPQCEIQRLLCNPAAARELLGWHAVVTLTEGVDATRNWLLHAS